jgi:lysozyme family protein
MAQNITTRQKQYEADFASMQVHPSSLHEAQGVAARLLAHKSRYDAVSVKTGVPWYLIAALHERESSGDFRTYLGNGELLDRVTHLVPANRGPFKDFEEGAVDALVHEGFDKVTDWSLGSILVHAEIYNGPGYFNRGVPSPYVWAGSDKYVRGKYASDGVYSSGLVDTQLGVAVIIKALAALVPDLLGKPKNQDTKMTDTPTATISVPAGTLKTAANVSSTTVKASLGLASLGALFTVAGPIAAAFFPSTANWIAEIAACLPGLGVAIGAVVHALHLSASAEAVTNAIIDSVTGAATAVTATLGGPAANPTRADQ